MWTVVYIAPSQKEADKLEKRLSSEGFLVKLHAIGAIQSGVASSIEVLVPESEVDEVMEVINAR
ncbi:MAG: glutamate decarboxylase [Peptococcaceae bacterium]|nr:glutamate decarboxylase [Peptococcaceae bacterium]